MASNQQTFRNQHAAQRAQLLTRYPRGGSFPADNVKARVRLAREARWLARRGAELAQALDAATLPRPTEGAYRSRFHSTVDGAPALVEYEFDFNEDHRGGDLVINATHVWFGGVRLGVGVFEESVVERLDAEALADFNGEPVAHAPATEPTAEDAARAEDAYIARIDSINAAREVAL